MKILKSLVIVVAMVALVAGVTNSFFSDTKVIAGNSITTGTIAINLNDVLEQTAPHTPFTLTDMKPGYVKSSDFTVNNTGSNPANITKKVDITSPEVNLAGVLDYKLSAEVFDPNNNLKWFQMIYNYDTTLAAVNHTEVFLGMLPANWHMRVHESYRMRTGAGNEYQNQTMGFDITIKGEQLKGILTLENKTGDPNWQIISDSRQGTLTYGVMDTMFNYTFNGVNLPASTGYTLLIGNDYPFSTGTVLGSGTTDGAGNISLGASVNLPTVTNQKVWLVLTSDWNGSSLTGWTPSSYLFETGLIDYYKSI